MAQCWKHLHAGQGDARDVRLERVRPSLDSVPNGLRRWLGVAFVSLQSSASLRNLFSGVYTDCLTASPHLQQRVHVGKDLIHKQRAAETLAKEDELARLRDTVDTQAALIKDLQANRAYDDDATSDSAVRLGMMEQTVARIAHALGPLLEELGGEGGEEADIRVLQVLVQTRRVIHVQRTDTRKTGPNTSVPA